MKKVLLSTLLASAVVFGISGCSDKSVQVTQPSAATQKTADKEVAVQTDVSKLPAYEKNGFLASKWCVENDYFTECKLETYVCGYGECWRDWEFGDEKTMELALYVQAERKYYNVVLSEEIALEEIEDLGFSRNDVTLKGYFDADSNTIIATGFDAPQPPADEFYKGCL